MSEQLTNLLGDEVIFNYNGGKSIAKIADLKDKLVGLYFDAHSNFHSNDSIQILSPVYQLLMQNRSPFGLIFVSRDSDQQSFDDFFNKQPWKAIPFVDEQRRNRIYKVFDIKVLPILIILNSNGELITMDGLNDVKELNTAAFGKWMKLAGIQGQTF